MQTLLTMLTVSDLRRERRNPISSLACAGVVSLSVKGNALIEVSLGKWLAKGDVLKTGVALGTGREVDRNEAADRQALAFELTVFLRAASDPTCRGPRQLTVPSNMGLNTAHSDSASAGLAPYINQPDQRVVNSSLTLGPVTEPR